MRSFIPTPSESYLSIGPFTVHFYAICIIFGIFAAIYIAGKREPELKPLISEISIYVIPAGIIGARTYHVVTTPSKYFNKHFLDIHIFVNNMNTSDIHIHQLKYFLLILMI